MELESRTEEINFIDTFGKEENNDKKGFRSRMVVFTVFSHKKSEEDLKRILRKETQWFVFGREICPITKALHFQGMAYAKSDSHRWSNWIGKGWAWIAKCRDNDKAYEYCVKDGDYTEEGDKPMKCFKSKRFTMKEALELTREDLKNLSPFQYNQVIKAIEHFKRTEPKIETPFNFEYFDWQEEILNYCSVINQRKILFIVDTVGNQGKTVFFGWLGQQPGYDYIGLMKKQDTFYIIDQRAHTIIIDVARDEVEHIQYALLEKIKDGFWTCGKYQGRKENSGCKNLIVCMNIDPNMNKLSQDRYDIRDLIEFKLYSRNRLNAFDYLM